MKRTSSKAPHRIPSRLTAIATGCALAFAMPTLAQAATVDFLLQDPTDYLSAVTNLSADAPAALANAQIRLNATTSTVENGSFVNTVTGTSSGPITVSGNAAAATATLNSATNSLSGPGAVNFTSETTKAEVTLKLPKTALAGSADTISSTIDASLVVASQQIARNASSAAQVSSTTVLSKVTGDMGNALTVNANSLSAQLTVNTATNVFNQQGGSGQFTGSVAVTNQQANTAALGGTDSNEITQEMKARVSDATIKGEVTGTNSSSITVSGNQQIASVQGNVAGALGTNGRILAGNALIISGANSVTGNLADTSTNGGGGDDISESRTLVGGLVLGSMQRSEGTNFTASIANSGVTAQALTSTAGNTITVRDNLQQASASGNLAGSLISVEANRIESGVAALNRQQLQDSIVESNITTSSTIAKTTGEEINLGAITVTGNRALASSSGNAGSLNTALTATSIQTKIDSGSSQYIEGFGTLSSTVQNQSIKAQPFRSESTALTVSGNELAASTSGNAVSTSVSLSGSSVLASTKEQIDQGLDNYSVTSSVSSASIEIASRSVASALTVSNNQINARTVGNAADATTRIAGTQLGSPANNLRVDLYGSQRVAGSDDMKSVVESADIRVDADGKANGSTITVSGNTMLASTTANTAQRALQLDGTSITASNIRQDVFQDSDIPVKATVDNARISVQGLKSTAASSTVVSDNTILALATANRGSNATTINATDLSGDVEGEIKVRSEQEMRTSMSAKTTAAQSISIDNNALVNGRVTLSNNVTAAQATANTTTNQMILNGTSLSLGTAKVENSQRRAGTVEATANGNTEAFVIKSVTDAAGKLTGGSLTVSNNQFAAIASGSTATNALQANAVSASGYVIIDNAQYSESTSIQASAKPRMIGVDAIAGDGTPATGVSIAVSGNSATASASANTASNQINLVAPSALNVVSWVTSIQRSKGLVSATLGDTAATPAKTLVGLAPLNDPRNNAASPITVSYGNVTVSDNRLIAQASANTVGNVLNLASAGSVGSSSDWKSFSVNSNQNTEGAVQTYVKTAYVGVDASSVQAAPLTVSGNTVAAVSAANTASNALTASGLPGSPVFAQLSLNNTQTATNTVSSSVSGVTIGNTVGAGTPSSAMTVAGNTMLAQSSGNTAVNRITGR
jgi:hypothetical protein